MSAPSLVDVIAGLEECEEETALKLDAVREAIAALRRFVSAPGDEASAAPKKPAKSKASKKVVSIEPRKKRGRLQSTGVSTEAFDSPAECTRFVAGLIERGLRRCGKNERLAAGLFDVWDRDGMTVQWIEPAEAA